MSRKKVIGDLLTVIVMTLVAFVILEASIRVAYFARNSMVTYVPLPYVIGDDYGPMPPWLDGLRILVPDEVFMWKSRSHLRLKYLDVFSPAYSEDDRRSLLRQFLPAVPDSFQNNPVWDISLNSQGFRDTEFSAAKRPSAFRIICLGDSWTFGTNVGQEETYPQQLQKLLKQEFPEADFEVLNLGVLGYTSYQGLELIKHHIMNLAPDLLVIGYAMNDASIAGYRDKDLAASPRTAKPWDKQLGEIAERSETYKLMRYLVKLLTDRPPLLGDHIKALHEADTGDWWGSSERRVMGQHDYDKMEPWTRVSPKDYEQNLLQMITLAKSHQATVVLLNNHLWPEGPYALALKKIARAEQIPLIDSSVLIETARKRIEDDLEVRLNLRDHPAHLLPPDGEVEVIFRVYAGDSPVSRSINIVGVLPQLGTLVPNKVAMYDDGTRGDQRAMDKVWSYAAKFPSGSRIFYVYTNSGQEGKWEGLDVPYIRAFRVASAGTQTTIYRPIETFGTIIMQADGWHTNAEGYGLIASALLEALKAHEKVKAYLALKDRFTP